MTLARARHARRGFTLVEVAISSVILGVILLAVGLTTTSGNRAYQAGRAQDRVSTLAQRALDRVADELAMGGATGLTPTAAAPLGSSTLTYRRPSGYAAGAVAWGTFNRIDFQYTPEDPNDGVDNDGDGFVDDGVVVLTRDVGTATEDSTVLVRGVREYLEGETPNTVDDNGNGLTDERGLSFVLAGDQLTIRLTLVARDSEKADITRTVSTVIKVRN